METGTFVPPTLALSTIRKGEERPRRNAVTPTNSRPPLYPSSPQRVVDEKRQKSPTNASTSLVPLSIKSGIRRLLSPKVARPASPVFTDNSVLTRKRPPTPGGRFDCIAEGAMIKRLIREDSEFHDTLLKFSENEFSSETIHFFDELIKYREAEEDKPMLFRQLYEKFIRLGSPNEVNLASCVREQVELFIATGDWAKAKDVEELLEYSAMTSLMDVFTRFELSEMYQSLKCASKPG
jgi:hypothetical protein